MKNVVDRCDNDLARFQSKLEKLVRHGNWISVAWKQQVAAPALARIDKSISERQQHLSMLLQLLQGYVMVYSLVLNSPKRIDHSNSLRQEQIHDMLRTLTEKHAIDGLLNPPGADQVTDTDSIISQVTTLIEKEEENAVGPIRGVEHNENGVRLLQAIQDKDNDAFELLLLDGDTSFKAMDDKKRNPLLLAAHLGRADMVKKLLSSITNARPGDRTIFHVPWDNSTIVTSASAPSNEDHDDDLQTMDHREIDVAATDKLGRNALHYCAEFDLCDEARFLLDNGVDVNAHDHNDNSPIYYAVKNRKYYAVQLLLAKGASTDFEWPTPTACEIEKLLKKPPTNDQLSPNPRSGSSRHSSVSALPPKKRSFSIARRWSSAKG